MKKEPKSDKKSRKDKSSANKSAQKSSQKSSSKFDKKSENKSFKSSEKKFSGKKFTIIGDGLPEICTLSIAGVNADGDLLAAPTTWKSSKNPPHIVVLESGRGKAAVMGDRILAKLRMLRPHFYQASIIRILESEQSQNIIGVFIPVSGGGGIIEPISRKNKESFMVLAADMAGAQQGELVAGATLPDMPSLGMSYAKITQRLGRVDAPRAASLIAATIHNLPSIFSAEALAEAEAAPLPTPSPERTDLRDIPLVTIDGEDARDFDDAVFAEPDGDGFHIVVAIAEVAFYVAEGSALDKAAFERGNSAYFPDRVIPMLPERLSNGLCSLNPDEDRYCLAVHIWIDHKGVMQKYEFVRGIMRSRARLTYEAVEVVSGKATNNKKKEAIAACHLPLITNLFRAYTALAHERDQRGALDLDLPEYKIHFDDSGNVSDIAAKTRLESHRLIECFMIAANVAAADFMLKHKASGIYRVHEAPSEEKLEDLRTMLTMSDYRLQKGAIYAKHFNRILKASANDPRKPMIHTAVLRAQMQAFYSAENTGHFGLGLQKYCHFTSPIRRYADLMVHRAIVDLLQSENGETHKKKHKPTELSLPEISLHISETERRAMLAERDAADRYKVSFMTKEIGNVFAGIIGGLNEHGLFVNLNATGVTGFIPVRNLGRDFFIFDRKHATFTGQRSKATFSLGDSVTIRVQEANAMTGSLIFGLEIPEFSDLPPLREKYDYKKKSPKHRGKNSANPSGKSSHKSANHKSGGKKPLKKKK